MLLAPSDGIRVQYTKVQNNERNHLRQKECNLDEFCGINRHFILKGVESRIGTYSKELTIWVL